MSRLYGRNKFISQLEDAALHGNTVLMLGPLGIGKTSILLELSSRMVMRGVPNGLARNTRCIGDITAALASAYPTADEPMRTQRQLRSRLRLAVETRAGVLLLDHVSAAGTAMKSFLRSMQGPGLGIILAIDIECRRDREAARKLHLTYNEVTVPPLAGRSMAALFQNLLLERAFSNALHEDDQRKLLRFARGNPGRLLTIMDLLADTHFWREGRVLTSNIDLATTELVLRSYLGKDAASS